ncbi:hypothetical protein [Cylindrospermopsis raciborskii]|nr:hypothetical protein [Cylindrospermopsis raciborskii]
MINISLTCQLIAVATYKKGRRSPTRISFLAMNSVYGVLVRATT